MSDSEQPLRVTCECGEKYEVLIGGRDLKDVELACPACGRVDRFSDDQIASVRTQREAIIKEARQIAVDELRKVTRGINRRNKRR